MRRQSCAQDCDEVRVCRNADRASAGCQLAILDRRQHHYAPRKDVACTDTRRVLESPPIKAAPIQYQEIRDGIELGDFAPALHRRKVLRLKASLSELER